MIFAERLLVDWHAALQVWKSVAISIAVVGSLLVGTFMLLMRGR